MNVGLVSCTKSKRKSPAPPQELYRESPYFRKASAYAEREHDRWYVLSAKHHLLDPDGPAIEPYDETLTNAGVEERREWAETVAEQLRSEGLLEPNVTLVVHAGKAYYEELLPHLPDHVEVEIPTRGLQLGPTLSWYNEQLDRE